MAELKIKVDQLKNYLGTGLKIQFKTSKGVKYHELGLGNFEDVINYTSNYNIICYRLSDLDKEIEHNGESFVPLEKIKGADGEYSIIQDSDGEIYFDDDCSLGIFEVTRCYVLVQKLFECHFWPFGDEYFEQGLVIDKRKIF